MKKSISLALVLLLSVGLAACSITIAPAGHTTGTTGTNPAVSSGQPETSPSQTTDTPTGTTSTEPPASSAQPATSPSQTTDAPTGTTTTEPPATSTQPETQPSQTSEVTTTNVERIELQLTSEAGAKVKGTIRAFSINGTQLWEYVTNSCYVGMCDVIQSIGITRAGYLFLEAGSVYCLDPATGKVRWVNEDFGGEGASWAFDTEENVYLTGYIEPWLFCIDPDGKTVVKHSVAPAEYVDAGFFWPESLFVDGDGKVHIHYMSNEEVMIMDPVAGTVLDTYKYGESLNADFLIGDWMDKAEYPSVRLRIFDNLNFEMFVDADNGVLYHYEGRFTLDTLNEKYSHGKDLLRSRIVSTDDSDFAKLGTVGDFVVTDSFRDGGMDDYIWLAPANGDDSVLRIRLDVYGIQLYRVPSIGP